MRRTDTASILQCSASLHGRSLREHLALIEKILLRVAPSPENEPIDATSPISVSYSTRRRCGHV